MLIRLVEYDFPTVFSRRKGEDGYRVLHISRGRRGNWRETQQFPIRLEITSMIGSDRRELLPGRNYTGTIAREIH